MNETLGFTAEDIEKADALWENAKAQVLVCDHAYGEEVNYLSNRLTQVFVGKNSTYEHYKLESSSSKTTNISTLQIYQEDSRQYIPRRYKP